jgi:uncharacterized RDD family membrane protein YckC
MTCPHCGREHESVDALAGMRVRCCHCDGWLQLPETPSYRGSATTPPSAALAVLPAVAVAVDANPLRQAIIDPPTLPLATQTEIEDDETEVFCPRCGVVNAVRKQRTPQEVVCVRCGHPFTTRLPTEEAPPVLVISLPSLIRKVGYTEADLADPWRRLFATAFDAAVTALPIGLLLVGLRQGLVPEEVVLAVGLLGILLVVYYQVYLLTVNGQTLGKRILSLRIVRADDGSNPGFLNAVLVRTCVAGLLYAIPLLGKVLFCFSVVWLFRPTHRTLHDLMAGTVVIEE